MSEIDDTICVLHVDHAHLASLEREDDRIDVLAASTVAEGLDSLAECDVDCVVSDHDPPDVNGLEFLEAVREDRADLPFILYTDAGSEAFASEAISAGVSEYLRTADGLDAAVLADTIVDVVETARNRGEPTRDVDDRNTRERELERYKTIFEALGDPVYVIDGEGNYTFVNDAFVEEIGYTREEVLGRHVSMVLPNSEIERGRGIIRRLLKTGDRTATWEVTRITADGEEIPAETHLALLPFEDGEFRGSAGVVRDISERRARERELEHQNERLEEFANVVSHDLRNPLNVVDGSLELARMRCDDENLERASRSLERAFELIEDLRILAQEGKAVTALEDVALGAVLEDGWANVETDAATLVDDVETPVRADESRLKQLFENLFRNAVEHGGSAVTVTVGEIDEGFYVADDGPGIPEDDRGHVFEAGYTTSSEGTGFGLRIVKGIVDAHGWEIEVAESESGGARFEITGVSAGGDLMS